MSTGEQIRPRLQRHFPDQINVGQTAPPAAPTVRFGAFVANLWTGELFKRARKVRLQEKPFQILKLLLERPGQMVTREELRRTLWPTGVFVDFDRGLKTAISKLRRALGDSAGNPQLVETLPRRGYRFVAPLKPLVRSPEPGASQQVKLAVLPFENLSASSDHEYFSDGVTEELISQLGRLHSKPLRVIARTSAMRYKRTVKSVDEIGRELNVHHVLEGSVRRSGSRVRITAQLVHVGDQTPVWTESYDHELHDELALQSTVAEAIAREVRATLAR
jgi:TolB-like protein